MTPQLKKDTTVEVISLDPRQQVICKHLKLQFYAVWKWLLFSRASSLMFNTTPHRHTYKYIIKNKNTKKQVLYLAIEVLQSCKNTLPFLQPIAF